MGADTTNTQTPKQRKFIERIKDGAYRINAEKTYWDNILAFLVSLFFTILTYILFIGIWLNTPIIDHPDRDHLASWIESKVVSILDQFFSSDVVELSDGTIYVIAVVLTLLIPVLTLLITIVHFPLLKKYSSPVLSRLLLVSAQGLYEVLTVGFAKINVNFNRSIFKGKKMGDFLEFLSPIPKMVKVILNFVFLLTPLAFASFIGYAWYNNYEISKELLKFQLQSSKQDMIQTLVSWNDPSNNSINEAKDLILYDYILIILYTAFFMGSIWRIHEASKNYSGPDKTKTWHFYALYITSSILAAIDFLENYLLTQVIDNSGKLDEDFLFVFEHYQWIQFVSTVKFILFIALFLRIQSYMNSVELFHRKIPDTGNFALTDINLMIQLGVLSYNTNQPAIKADINKSKKSKKTKLSFDEHLDFKKAQIEVISQHTKTHQAEGSYLPPDSLIRESIEGFICHSVEKKTLTIYVVFRGSEVKVSDVYTDMSFVLRPLFLMDRNEDIRKKEIKGVLVHTGFLLGYLTAEQKIRETIVEIISEEKKSNQVLQEVKIVFTGHSLGGGFATIGAVRTHRWLLEYETYETDYNKPTSKVPYDKFNKIGENFCKNRVQVVLFAFGSPRVGNYRFKREVDRLLKSDNQRFDFLGSRNDQEWAPRLPPIGYWHIRPIIWWNSRYYPKDMSNRNTVVSFWYTFWELIGKYFLPMLIVGPLKGVGSIINSYLPEQTKSQASEILADHHRWESIRTLRNYAKTFANINDIPLLFESVEKSYLKNVEGK